MKESLKIILSAVSFLAVLNALYYFGFLPFVKQSVGSHNGKELYPLCFTFIIGLILLIKGIVSLIGYPKDDLKLSLLWLILGVNLLFWVFIFSNVECISCTLN